MMNLKIKFTQAKDNDMVYSYRISFIERNTNKTIKTISTLSDFYLHGTAGRDGSLSCKVSFKMQIVCFLLLRISLSRRVLH